MDDILYLNGDSDEQALNLGENIEEQNYFPIADDLIKETLDEDGLDLQGQGTSLNVPQVLDSSFQVMEDLNSSDLQVNDMGSSELDIEDYWCPLKLFAIRQLCKNKLG